MKVAFATMISLNRTEKIFSNKAGTWKFGSVTLDIPKGDFLAIVGKSGSGKSTLLHLIGGLLKPTSGGIFFRHKNINTFSENQRVTFRNKHIGFVFQDFFLLEEFSLFENIAMPLILRNEKEEEIKEKTTKAIAQVRLSGKEKNFPAELSGGQKQRAAIARAIVGNPNILLADEPTGNLDEETGKEVIQLLIDIQKERKMTLLLATHDPSLTQSASRILEIKDGKIKKELATKEEVMAK